MQTMKFQLEGITCSGCAMDMETVLMDTDGIEDAAVNYAEGIVTIEFDPREIAPQEVHRKVEGFNFTTRLLNSTDAT